MKPLSGERSCLWLTATSGGSGAVTLGELVNTACGIHKALLTGKERVAACANTDLQVFDRGKGGVNRTASAGNGCFKSFWMRFLFHILRMLGGIRPPRRGGGGKEDSWKRQGVNKFYFSTP